MPDKERELKVLCEVSVDDFLKNTSKGGDWDNPRFLISSHPYIRKNNLIADRAMVSCWETHFRFKGDKKEDMKGDKP